MLSLVELKVTNFRSIREETFPLQNLSILIGKNNSGKTNLLDSIEILLEGTSKDVTKEAFFDTNADFVIIGRFSGIMDYLPILDQRHKPRIEERIDGKGCITIRRIGHATDHTLDKIEICQRETDTFDLPTGIDAALRQLLPEVVFLRPLADVADELSGKTSSAMTKILAQILEQIEVQAQPLLENAYQQANALLNVMPDSADSTKEVDRRIGALRQTEDAVSGYLNETFPRSKARLRIEMPTVKQIMGNVEMLVNDGTLWTPYYRQGHGLQRVLLLSLLRALAVQLRQNPETKVRRPFMLLIEEPELFLHPVAQEQMRAALESISGSNQVIYATHSPLLVSANCLPGLVRVHKVPYIPQKSEETRKVGTPISEQDVESSRDILTILNLQRSAQLFFATTIILVEGEGDLHLHRALIEKLLATTLELVDVALVEVGGKYRLARIKDLLVHFCPRVVAISDLDYLWTNAGTELKADPVLSQLCEKLRNRVKDEMAACSDIDNEKLRKLCKECMKKHCVSDEFRTMRDDVCVKLEALGIFVLRNGEIEDYIGLGESAKGKYLSAAMEITAGKRSVAFEEELRQLYRKIIQTPDRAVTAEPKASANDVTDR